MDLSSFNASARLPIPSPPRLGMSAAERIALRICQTLIALHIMWVMVLIPWNHGSTARLPARPRSPDLQAPMKKNLDIQRQALQRARDELQKGIDDYEETPGWLWTKVSWSILILWHLAFISGLVNLVMYRYHMFFGSLFQLLINDSRVNGCFATKLRGFRLIPCRWVTCRPGEQNEDTHG